MPTSLHPRIYMLRHICRNFSQQLAVPAKIMCMLGFFLSACISTPMPASPLATDTPPLPSFVTDVSGVNLPSLVVAEREASISGNLPLLASLWAEDGRIVDGRGSADT